MNDKSPIVSQLARQMFIEYGDSAQSVVRGFIERCRSAGDFDWAQNWEAVCGALLQLQPGRASKF
jgi:hypothetical protein